MSELGYNNSGVKISILTLRLSLPLFFVSLEVLKYLLQSLF